MLQHAGWTEPDPEALPTGAELVAGYLQPLAKLPELEAHIRFGARVTAVARTTHDKMKTGGRERAPFEVRVRTATGEESLLARAVIDASGTYAMANPLGSNGLAAVGEPECRAQIFYGIPDVLGSARERYAGRAVAVVGSGHSAFNALLELARLGEVAPATTITWVVRRDDDRRSLRRRDVADALPARGSLGARLRALVDAGRIRLASGFRTNRLERTERGIALHDPAGESSAPSTRSSP